ncbi:MAG: PLP-dependent aminotransferase family protein [Candidatus Methanomethyliaceae archaeon]
MDEVLALTRGNPPAEALPVSWLTQCCEFALKKYGNILLQYHSAYGFAPLRESLAKEAGASSEEVVVCNGSIQILHFLAKTLLAPGDSVIVERPTYDRAITAFRQAGVTVVGVPLEEDGVGIKAFEQMVQKFSPKLFYIIPDFQNPTGVTTSLEKRLAIVEIAKRYNMFIVEDIAYRKLRYIGSDVPTFRELIPHQVIQIASFSKLIAPGLRVGYLIAQEKIAKHIGKLAEDAYITPNMLSQGIVYEFLIRGFFDLNLQNLKSLYMPRLSAMLKALQMHLPQGNWTRPEGGFFVGLWLTNSALSIDTVFNLARTKGLLLAQSVGFFPDDDPSGFIRLPFCGLSEEQIFKAIKCLADAVNQAALCV